MGTVADRANQESKASIKLFNYYNDALVHNRSAFINIIRYILDTLNEDLGTAAMMLIDVDNFRDLNNVYGYKFGDELLKNIGELLSVGFQRYGILAHYEKDCFALFISSIEDAENAVEIAKKIINMFHMPWVLGKHECYSTVSIGISIYPSDGKKVETLIKNAESALAFVKKQGRDRYQLYSKTIDKQITKRLGIEYSLRKAIEKNEFIVYYQPQVNIKTGAVVSLEALVRWAHPTEGIIPPSVFIPIAEEIGLIDRIGELVLQTACMQVKELNSLMQSNITIAVNLSPRQLQNKDLSDKILEIIENVQFNPQLLEIEITEEAAIKDINTTIKLLKDLGDKNIKIALDDFCTGYSSLCYLELLPVHKIKIDKSFIDGINKNYKKESIVEALINLSHRLGNVIVAEGVEEESQYKTLKEKNCDIVQGYYFSKPLSFDALVKYFKRMELH
jgi:polar amino acid transport system substrate-binding protein